MRNHQVQHIADYCLRRITKSFVSYSVKVQLIHQARMGDFVESFAKV